MTTSSGQPLILHNLTLLDMVRDAPLPDAVVRNALPTSP